MHKVHVTLVYVVVVSVQNLLALASEDLTLTISNSEGDTLRSAPLSGSPTLLQFAAVVMGGEEGYMEEEEAVQDSTVSYIFMNMCLLSNMLLRRAWVSF